MTFAWRLALSLVATLLPALALGLAWHTLATRDALQAQWAQRSDRVAQELAALWVRLPPSDPALQVVARSKFSELALEQLVLATTQGAPLVQLAAPAAAAGPAWWAAQFGLDAGLGEPRALAVDVGGTAARLTVLARADDLRALLWAGFRTTALLLLGLAALAAAAVALVLRGWLRPLAATVAQARSLADAKLYENPEPRWLELRDLTRAMNTMVRRLREQFQAQADQVARLQQQAQTDAVTGLAVRAQFLRELERLLGGDHAPPTALLIVRVPELERLNERHGREAIDRLLSALADVLLTYVERVPGAAAGRLNGTDFALVLPAAGMARETAETLRAALASAPAARLAGARFVVGGCDGLTHVPPGAALAAADAALARAEEADVPVVEDRPDRAGGGSRAWRELIADALEQGRVRLAEYPVLSPGGALLHLECPLRVQLEPDGEFHEARRWLALAARSRLMPQVDLAALDLALKAIALDNQPRCVHVSARSFRLPGFAAAVQTRLQRAGAAASRLWIEWAAPTDPLDSPEADALRRAVPAWRRLGACVGVEHAGASPRALPVLREFGIEYVKVDSRHLIGLAEDDAVRSHAQSLVALIHGLELLAFAEGTDRAEDLPVLWALGFDGATGPVVRQTAALPG